MLLNVPDISVVLTLHGKKIDFTCLLLDFDKFK